MILTGFGGRIFFPEFASVLQVVVLLAIGGAAFVGIVVLVQRRFMPIRDASLYGVIGAFELAHGVVYTTAVILLVDSFALAIPLIRIHTTYLILVIGVLFEKLGWATNETITARKIICACVTVLGLGLLGIDKFQQGFESDDLIGVALLLLSVLLSTSQHFYQARVAERLGEDSIVAGTFSQLTVTIVLGLAILQFQPVAWPDVASTSLLLTYGVAASGIAFLMRFIAYSRYQFTSFEMAVRQEIEHVLQAVTLIVFVSAVVTPLTVLGMLLVFGAAFFVKVDEDR